MCYIWLMTCEELPLWFLGISLCSIKRFEFRAKSKETRKKGFLSRWTQLDIRFLWDVCFCFIFLIQNLKVKTLFPYFPSGYDSKKLSFELTNAFIHRICSWASEYNPEAFAEISARCPLSCAPEVAAVLPHVHQDTLVSLILFPPIHIYVQSNIHLPIVDYDHQVNYRSSHTDSGLDKRCGFDNRGGFAQTLTPLPPTHTHRYTLVDCLTLIASLVPMVMVMCCASSPWKPLQDLKIVPDRALELGKAFSMHYFMCGKLSAWQTYFLFVQTHLSGKCARWGDDPLDICFRNETAGWKRFSDNFVAFCHNLLDHPRSKEKKKDEAKNLRFCNRTVMQHLRNVCEPVSQSRHSSYYCRTLHDPRRLGAEWNRWLAAGPLCGDRSHGIDSDATSKKYSERKYRQLRLSHTSLFFHIPHLWYFFHTHYCLCLSCSMYLCIGVTCNLMGNGVIVCVCGCVSVYPHPISHFLSHSLSHYFPSRITHVRMRSKANTSHVSIATKLFAATWMASSAVTDMYSAVVRHHSINSLRKKDG